MQPQTRHTGPMPWRIVIPVASVALVALLYLASRPLGGGEELPSFFVIGSALPGVQLGQVAPGTDEAPAAPALTLTDLEGAPVTLADFHGKPIWLLFWKTACDPCEAEAADVAAAYAAHRPDGLVLLGVDVWDTAAAVQEWATSHTLAYPIAVAPTSAFMDAYGVWGAPTHYFIAPGGIIGDRYFGPMSRELIDKSLRKII